VTSDDGFLNPELGVGHDCVWACNAPVVVKPVMCGLIHLCAYHVRAASIPVVGFNAVLTSEHFGSFLTFGVLHAALLIQYIKARKSPPGRPRQGSCSSAGLLEGQSNMRRRFCLQGPDTR